MTSPDRVHRGALLAAVLFAALPWVGCRKMSELIEDESVGMNGGFEHARDGVPVNWLVYNSETVKEGGDFDIILDTKDFKEGRQSLKFLIRECSAIGGWHSPGIAREYPALSGETYLISLWVKSEGSAYLVRIGGVDAWNGDYETVDSFDPASDGWKLVEYEFTMPGEYETIRFELNALSPGSLWVDDVRIELVDQGSSGRPTSGSQNRSDRRPAYTM